MEGAARIAAMTRAIPPPPRRCHIETEQAGGTSGWQASAIEYESVKKEFPGGKRPGVDGVSLRVEPSQFTVLLGPSGCGKTTLLKLTNRLYEPTGGRITVDGTDIRNLPITALRRRMGYVIQQSGLFPHMRIADNVAVVPKLLGWKRDRIAARVDKLLDLVGLPAADYRRRYPAQLSGGEQQRVGLARALAAEPSTLLMDEPFGALDAITRARLQDELRRIHSILGQTVLFVTHDIEEAVRLADKIVVMRHGRVVQYDTPLNIVLKPADDFVADLVGAGDVLRRLSLLPAHSAITPLGDGTDRISREEPRLSGGTPLREALSVLLEGKAPRLIITNEEDEPVGTLDLHAVQRASVPNHEDAPQPADPRARPT